MRGPFGAGYRSLIWLQPRELGDKSMGLTYYFRSAAACYIVGVGLALFTSSTDSQVTTIKDIRFVVIHTQGPNWKPGVPAFEQPGLQQHVEHYRKLLDSGKLTMGGPFMDDTSGGMMIPEPTIQEEEIRKFANDDPAVQSGLLKFTIRPWLPRLQK
jgi:uncharacterized protein YciI